MSSEAEIRRVDVYMVRYTHAGGPFSLSGGRVAAEQDATVVRVETSGGLVGWGEQCVFTPTFLPGYGPSTRATLEPLAHAVLGADARAVEVVYARMDAAVRGYAYAKSALDIACWDVLGKATGLRVSDLLGGTRQEELELYTGVGVAAPEAMRKRCGEVLAAGFRQVQLKVGTGWRDDVERIRACVDALAGADRVIVDANGYWPQADAVRVVAAVDDLDIFVEQPCASVTECAHVRSRSRRPFILDEVLTGAREIVEANAAGALDAVRLKLSNVGGITPTRRARDVAVTLGLPLTIEDAGGGDIVTAAATHLACSTEPNRPAPHAVVLPLGAHIREAGLLVEPARGVVEKLGRDLVALRVLRIALYHVPPLRSARERREVPYRRLHSVDSPCRRRCIKAIVGKLLRTVRLVVLPVVDVRKLLR